MIKFPAENNYSEEKKLWDAIVSNDLKTVNKILSGEVDLNVLFRQNNGETITLLQVAVGKGYHAIVDLLLSDPRTHVNLRNNKGITALVFAIGTQKVEMARKLLSKGADPDMSANNGMTPLHLAVQLQNIEMVKVLLMYNANPNIAVKGNVTSLRLAIVGKNAEMVSLLLKHNANPNIDKELARHCGDKKIIGLLELYSMHPGSPRRATSLKEKLEVISGTEKKMASALSKNMPKPDLKIVAGVDTQGEPA